MEKYRKAVVELCAAIELVEVSSLPEGVEINQQDWRLLRKLVDSVKLSFNHSMQYHYEQHIKRESDFRAANRPPAQKGGEG